MPLPQPPAVKYFTKNTVQTISATPTRPGGFYYPEKTDVLFFLSGLGRINANIIGSENVIENIANTLKSGTSFPSWAVPGGYVPIENAFIFPDPLMEQIGAGLVRLKITAFGKSRSNAPATTNFGSRIVVLNKSYSRTESETRTVNNQSQTFTVTVTTNITEKWIVDTATTTLAVESTLSSTAIAPAAPTLAKKLIRRSTPIVTTDGENSYPPIPTAISINWSTEIVSVTRRNFGKTDEAEVTFEPIPYI